MPRERRFNRRRRAEFAMRMPQAAIAEVSSAAARRVKDATPPPGLDKGWQTEAYAMNERIGEVGYLHHLTANTIASCEFRGVHDVPGGEDGVITSENTDPRVTRVMAAFVGPTGDQSELRRAAALHYQIAGEAYLIGTEVRTRGGMPAGIAWEFLSVQEFQVEGSGVSRKATRRANGEGQGTEIDTATTFIARLWRRDPVYSGRVDSPMRRVLPLCRELIVLSEVIEAIARSSLSANALFIPDELSFGPEDDNSDEADEDDVDPFDEELIDHMTTPIEDRTSAASVVPFLIRGAAEFGEKIANIDLGRNLDEQFAPLRKEILLRLAQGLDAPPEVMSGRSSLNHWSAYAVDADFITKHVNPVGEAIANFLTIAYLRPMLIEHEGMTPEEAMQFRLVFDSRKITSRADEGPAAMSAWDRIILSDLATLRANGFEAEDLPSDEERRRRLLEGVLMGAPVQFGPTILPLLYPDLAAVMEQHIEDQIHVENPDLPTDENGRTPETPSEDPSSRAPDESDVQVPDGSGPGTASIDDLVDRLREEADRALRSALDAGSEAVHTRINGSMPTIKAALEDVPSQATLAALSDGDYLLLGIDPMTITGTGWQADYEVGARSTIATFLKGRGVPERRIDEVARQVAASLVPEMTAYLALASRNPGAALGGIPKRLIENRVIESMEVAVRQRGTLPAPMPRLASRVPAGQGSAN